MEISVVRIDPLQKTVTHHIRARLHFAGAAGANQIEATLLATFEPGALFLLDQPLRFSDQMVSMILVNADGKVLPRQEAVGFKLNPREAKGGPDES